MCVQLSVVQAMSLLLRHDVCTSGGQSHDPGVRGRVWGSEVRDQIQPRCSIAIITIKLAMEYIVSHVSSCL